MSFRLFAQAKEPVQEGMAAAGTLTSLGGAGWAWFGHASDILQVIVMLVAIVSGIASYRYYSRKRKEMDQ